MEATPPPDGTPSDGSSPAGGDQRPPRAPEPPAPRRHAYEARTRVLMSILGVLFMVDYSLIVLIPDPPRPWGGVLVAVLVVTWAAFVVDYLLRVLLSPRHGRWTYVWRRPIDVLSVVLPIFRALRVVDLIRSIPYFHRRTGSAARSTIVVYLGTYAIVFVYFIALSTLYVERPAPDARILNFGDAIWWAFETISTVGYGDMYPVTALGRFYAVLLMMGGVVIIGVVSATVLSFLNERVRGLKGHRE